jgi:hypothetical protein
MFKSVYLMSTLLSQGSQVERGSTSAYTKYCWKEYSESLGPPLSEGADIRYVRAYCKAHCSSALFIDDPS